MKRSFFGVCAAVVAAMVMTLATPEPVWAQTDSTWCWDYIWSNIPLLQSIEDDLTWSYFVQWLYMNCFDLIAQGADVSSPDNFLFWFLSNNILH